jgi:hypothetical protein
MMKDGSSRIDLKIRPIAGRLRMIADRDYVPTGGTKVTVWLQRLPEGGQSRSLIQSLPRRPPFLPAFRLGLASMPLVPERVVVCAHE